jgi:hypothetical protein
MDQGATGALAHTSTESTALAGKSVKDALATKVGTVTVRACHRCLCAKDAPQFVGRACPICRGRVTGVLAIFDT